MKSAFCVLAAVIALSSPRAGAEPGGLLSFRVTPEVQVPAIGSQQIFDIGGGAAIEARLAVTGMAPAYPMGLLQFTLLPTPADKSLSLFSGGLGVGFQYFPHPRFGVGASAAGGYYSAVWGDVNAAQFFLRGSADLTYRFTPAVSVSLGGSYNYYFGPGKPLFQGFGIFLGGGLSLAGLRGQTHVQSEAIDLAPVFPIFHAFYDKNSLGTVTLVNGEDGAIQDVRVSFFVKQYMDQPKLSASYPSLERGASVEVPLYALFTEQVLKLTESTRAAAEIIVDYSFLGAVRQARFGETLRLYHRNAMTWDDDRKVAAFVSAKDPAVLRFSKYAAGLIREQGEIDIDQNLRFAMGLLEGLRLYGLNYVVDPTTPYEELSTDASALDYLQYPYQTLVYKGGDCDDLSIAYSAILESVGISTAFITIPGHIYMAFALQMSDESARRTFLNPDELVLMEGKAWVPVEVTLLNEGFTKAWLVGAKQWQDNAPSGAAVFIPVESAWQVYEPVGIPGEDTRIVLPDPEQLVGAYKAGLSRFIDRELTPRVRDLRSKIHESGGDPRLVNRLGVLYARYGMYDEAKVEFERALLSNYPLALSNLGNIAYLKNDYQAALSYYQQALDAVPNSKAALLGMARAQYELENYTEAGRAYALVHTVDPGLAAEYAYLASRTEGPARASASAAERQKTGGAAWDEE